MSQLKILKQICLVLQDLIIVAVWQRETSRLGDARHKLNAAIVMIDDEEAGPCDKCGQPKSAHPVSFVGWVGKKPNPFLGHCEDHPKMVTI